MPSSAIREFRYDVTRNELTVCFATGRMYVYSLVPPSVYAAMESAPSKGAYFNEHIRDRYGLRQLGSVPERRAEAGPSLRESLKRSRDG